jgi:mTERF domain-containing protein
MYHFIRRTLLENRNVSSKTSYIRYIQTAPSFNSVSNPTEQQSLTVSYLVKSCGLSLEQAISASKVIRIENTEKPDSLLKMLDTYGFTKTHISTMICKLPSLILAHPEKTIRPKIEYFQSLGIRGPDLPKIICSATFVLRPSLEKQIIPTIDFLKGFIETDEKLVNVLKQSTRIVQCNINKFLVPNISTLRAHGVPKDLVAKLIIKQSRSVLLRTDLFEEVVCAIKEMGFEPTSVSFILAVRCRSTISKVKWEKKKGVLMSFGWSESEFLSAFRVQPMLMLCSEKKIRDVMDFLMNKVGLKPSDIARGPNLFLVSVERRMIPRCAVLQVLMSKAMVKEINLISALNSNKQYFEKKFVTPYLEDAPEVIKAFQGKMVFQGFSN